MGTVVLQRRGLHLRILTPVVPAAQAHSCLPMWILPESVCLADGKWSALEFQAAHRSGGKRGMVAAGDRTQLALSLDVQTAWLDDLRREIPREEFRADLFMYSVDTLSGGVFVV